MGCSDTSPMHNIRVVGNSHERSKRMQKSFGPGPWQPGEARPPQISRNQGSELPDAAIVPQSDVVADMARSEDELKKTQHTNATTDLMPPCSLYVGKEGGSAIYTTMHLIARAHACGGGGGARGLCDDMCHYVGVDPVGCPGRIYGGCGTSLPAVWTGCIYWTLYVSCNSRITKQPVLLRPVAQRLA